MEKSQYKSLQEWAKAEPKAYAAAYRKQVLHMVVENYGWKLETKITFLSYKEARKFVHKLKIKNVKEWREYCKSGNKPDNIPANPNRTYKNIWISYGDWLGTENVAPQNKKFLTFDKTRLIIQKLKIKNIPNWLKYCRSGNKPDNIPTHPNRIYKDLWVSWDDFLGISVLSFEEARAFVHLLKLKNTDEWFEYCKSGNKPDNIPTTSNRYYKDMGWVSWGDWLGYKILYV